MPPRESRGVARGPRVLAGMFGIRYFTQLTLNPGIPLYGIAFLLRLCNLLAGFSVYRVMTHQVSITPRKIRTNALPAQGNLRG
jgi:hypothetical protein